jgi:hypothetical protein
MYNPNMKYFRESVTWVSELGSSVSIVSGYWLDDQAIEVQSLAEVKWFFLKPICPDQLWGPLSLLYNGHWGVLSPGLKHGQGITQATHPNLVPRSRISRSCTSCPSKHLLGVLWDSFIFFFLVNTSKTLAISYMNNYVCFQAMICVWYDS